MQATVPPRPAVRPSVPLPGVAEVPTWKDAANVGPMTYVRTEAHGMVPAWRVTGRLPGPWPYDPDTCPQVERYEEYRAGHWTRDGQVLMCCGCGLDCT